MVLTQSVGIKAQVKGRISSAEFLFILLLLPLFLNSQAKGEDPLPVPRQLAGRQFFPG
jgi:hypothetical protein